MKLRTRLSVLTLMALLGFSAYAAEDMRIVAPYLGSFTDKHSDSNVGTLKDTGLLTGLFFQWVRPSAFQWNVFGYYAPDVNYADTYGIHLQGDWYFAKDSLGKWALGGGVEFIRTDLDAGNAFYAGGYGPSDFVQNVDVYVPYVRLGKYFNAKLGPAELSLMPWAGVQPEWVRGDMSMNIMMGPPPAVHLASSLDDYYFYGIAGATFKALLFHFVDLEYKYQGTFDAKDYYSTNNVIANVFLSRTWALSYRFKYMEGQSDKYTYHYFGVGYVF